MCKKEVFRAALSAVAAETEIPEECILSRCKRREVVEVADVGALDRFERGMPRGIADRGETILDTAVESLSVEQRIDALDREPGLNGTFRTGDACRQGEQCKKRRQSDFHTKEKTLCA